MSIKRCLAASLILVSFGALAKSLPQYAPGSVNGMTFYGNIHEKSTVNKNIILNFRAPLMKNNRIAFYPVTGPNKGKAGNSGVYNYKKLSANKAQMTYVATKGLTPPYLFKFYMKFTKQNAGLFMAKVYNFKNNKPSINTAKSQLKYVKQQTGTFSFKK